MALLAVAPVSTASAATWRVIEMQTFEANFPGTDPAWAIRDVNGPSVGGVEIWDDSSQRAYKGAWAAHPSDGGPYPTHVDTWMRYGPFSLVGARDANYSFWYWMDTELQYDEFGWQHSCDGGKTWTGTQISGIRKSWKKVTVSLKPCVGKVDVRIRWTFESDYSNPSGAELAGVFVDNVKIQKLV